MKRMKLGNELDVPVIGLGCMRIWDKPISEVERLIATSLELGINFFDHADIYGGGKSEETFDSSTENLKIPRDEVIIQTKCGIRSGFMTFQRAYHHICRKSP